MASAVAYDKSSKADARSLEARPNGVGRLINPCRRKRQRVIDSLPHERIINGRYWNRTSDSYRVKVVLYL